MPESGDPDLYAETKVAYDGEPVLYDGQRVTFGGTDAASPQGPGGQVFYDGQPVLYDGQPIFYGDDGIEVIRNALVPDADALTYGAFEFSSAEEAKGPLFTRTVQPALDVALPYIRSPAAAPPFFVVELDAYAPAVEVPGGGLGHGARAHGVLPGVNSVPASSETVRVSDLGYRTREADAGGLAVYPPLLEEAFALDRAVELDTAASGVSVGWGAIRLANPQGQWDALAARSNSDGRDARILIGTKLYDPQRGIELDPPRASLRPFFAGVSTPWRLSETTLDVPLRDAGYWLERPLQGTLYVGGGGLEGGDDLKGRPKPKTRGGTLANPVLNVAPVLVDPLNRIYQWSDAPGELVALYEAGGAVFTYAGDVPDLYAGGTPPGGYRTNKARALFQLGSTAVRSITADVTGAFPSGAVPSTALAVAARLFVEDMLLPPALLDAAAFAREDAARPYVAGWHWGPEPVEAQSAANVFLGPLGAKLVPTRGGPLSVLVLRRVAPGNVARVALGTAEIVSLTPVALPPRLQPPPYRFRVGYGRAHAVQTSDLSPRVTDARKSLVAAEYRYAGWFSGDTLLAYRRPNDPEPIGGALLRQEDAQRVADELGELWGGAGRSLYSVTVPTTLALDLDIGDEVWVSWPIYGLANGRLGQIVGDTFRSRDAVVSFLVLV